MIDQALYKYFIFISMGVPELNIMALGVYTIIVASSWCDITYNTCFLYYKKAID